MNQINKTRKSRQQLERPLLDHMTYGKVPPQATDLEESVLGAIMLVKGAIDIAQEILIAECFYKDAHQRIFKAMQSLDARSIPIDILTVVEELKTREELDLVGGPFFVTRLTNNVVSSANIETHSRIIFQKFIQREIIRIGGQMVSAGFEDSTDAFELLEETEANILGITMDNIKTDYSHIEGGMVKTIRRLEELRNRESTLTGIPSGFKELDACTNGWQDTDLIIIAARPSVGKTAFALNLLRNAAMDQETPRPVGYFSLEMSTQQLIQRILSAETEIWLERIRNGKLEDYHMRSIYEKGASRLSKAPIYIDDTASLNMFQLRSKARRMKRRHGIKMIIIDYLQLMSGENKKSNGNREQEISKISRDLKGLAKELEIPVIALSQLSRDIEKRGSKEPQLSDLRESGAIEQDADIVMFLYRPSKEDQAKDPDLKGTGTAKIAKHRNGTLEDIVLRFRGEIQKWEDINAVSSMGKIKPLTVVRESENFEEEEEMPF